MFIRTTHTTPGTLCPHCLQPQLVTHNPQSVSLYPQLLHLQLLFYIHVEFFFFFIAGTLISHEKLLLQINTEREMGNMDYKLGQV